MTVIIGLSSWGGTSVAAENPLKRFGSQLGVAPAETLPPTSNPTFYRQRVLISCAFDEVAGGDLCRMVFDRIDDGRLLEIATINCLTPDINPVFWLFKSPKFELTANNLVALFPLTGTGNLHPVTVHGPFYFRARERPTIIAFGTAGDPAFCSIAGTLWQTD